jgi:hypothetical protein
LQEQREVVILGASAVPCGGRLRKSSSKEAEAMSELERRVEAMLASQEIDPSLVQEVLALPPDDPEAERILAKLLEAVGDQGPSPLMNIEDYYRPGDATYDLIWPLAPSTAAVLTFPFEALDRKTQFFVLFQEWTRREAEGSVATVSGDPDGAKAIFEECLARADQLDVAELRARSYDGLRRVAEVIGDREAARQALAAAMSERDASQS